MPPFRDRGCHAGLPGADRSRAAEHANLRSGIFVRKQSDANVVDTANGSKQSWPRCSPRCFPAPPLTVASDATKFINSSLDETRLNLVESIITTALVLFLFLRRWRSSLIVLVAIPISLVGTFFAMWPFHFTLNIVSLMALGLCIGILVDDSIVILENVDRHIQLGEDPRTAAVRGRMEIGLAAVAITLCDVVVFAPIAFLTDIVGQFFREFGLTVVCATLLSLLVSFTVTPMMASRMLVSRRARRAARRKPGVQKLRRPALIGGFFETTIKGGYRRFLEWSPRSPGHGDRRHHGPRRRQPRPHPAEGHRDGVHADASTRASSWWTSTWAGAGLPPDRREDEARGALPPHPPRGRRTPSPPSAATRRSPPRRSSCG